MLGLALKGIACVIGIILNIFVAIVIFRQTNLNYTFKFMINLAISDTEYLLSILVVGLLSLFIGDNEAEWGTRLLRVVHAFLNESSLRSSEFFLVFLSLTRWLQFAKPNLLFTFFTGKKFMLISVLCWFIPHALYFPIFFDTHIFLYYDEYYIYGNRTLSYILQSYDTCMNFGSLILQVLFNVLSCVWIISMRRKVMTPELKAKHKQEVKLFVQCAIDSFVFFLAMFFYDLCVFGGICDLWVITLLHITVILNSLDCAVLYICFNRNIRMAMEKFMCCSGRATATVAVAVANANHNNQIGKDINPRTPPNQSSPPGMVRTQHH